MSLLKNERGKKLANRQIGFLRSVYGVIQANNQLPRKIFSSQTSHRHKGMPAPIQRLPRRSDHRSIQANSQLHKVSARSQTCHRVSPAAAKQYIYFTYKQKSKYSGRYYLVADN